MRPLRYIVVSVIIFIAVQARGQAVNPAPMLVLPRNANTPGLILEYERAIYILNQGIAKGWTTSGQFLDAFDKANKHGTAGEILTPEWRVVRSDLARSLPSDIHQIWDEHQPYSIAVQQQSVRLLELPLDGLLIKDALAVQKFPK